MLKRDKKTVKRLVALLLLVFVFTFAPQIKNMNFFPNEIKIWEGESYTVNCNLPFKVSVSGDNSSVINVNDQSLKESEDMTVNLSEPVSFQPKEKGTVNLEFKLFGFIPVKTVTVDVLPELYVIPGGHSIGLKLKSEGVIVIQYSDILSGGHSVNPAKEAGIEVGDVILEINGTAPVNLNHAAELINNASSSAIELLVDRNGEEKTFSITPRLL